MPKYDSEESVARSLAVATAAGKTQQWADYVIHTDPFAGDFGDGTSRTLRDELVVAKRGGKCRGLEGACERGVKAGELTRVINMADSEGFYGGRICIECLDADWQRDHEDAEDDEDVDPFWRD